MLTQGVSAGSALRNPRAPPSASGGSQVMKIEAHELNIK